MLSGPTSAGGGATRRPSGGAGRGRGGEGRVGGVRRAASAGSGSRGGSRCGGVAWGPAGSEIALIAAGTGRLERRIGAPGAGALSDPAWSPDGRRIAFTGTNGGSSSLYLVDLDGGGVPRFTAGGFSHLPPALSPSGPPPAFPADRSPAPPAC